MHLKIPRRQRYLFLSPYSSLLCGLLLGSLLVPFTTPSAWADESGDWKELTALRKQIGEEPLKSNPAQAREQLQAFGKSRVLDAVVAAEAAIQAATITRTQLQQPDEAMKLLQAGWLASQQKIDPAKPTGVMYLDTLAAALLEDKQPAQVKALLEENRAAVYAGGNSGNETIEAYTSRTIERLIAAQALLGGAEAGPEETATLLQTALVQMPVFLDPGRQRAINWRKGWMYERLMTSLVKAELGEEALQWGKLFFAQSSYNQESITAATNALNGVWIALGDPAQVRAFAQAQTSAQAQVQARNPLAGVSFPKLDDKLLQVALERQQGWLTKWKSRRLMPPIITLEMARGNWKGAMEMAQGMLQSDATAPDGPQQIARVMKGKDGNIARANQFLAYLDGNAANPLPAFLAEIEMAPAAP